MAESMSEITPGPEFVDLSEAQVLAALDDSQDNPIAIEVARLVSAYGENFRRHVEHLGRIPDTILREEPGTPIQAVAMKLTTQTISRTIEGERR